MQATTAFVAHRSFPPGSAARRSFQRWVRTLDPPIWMEPNVGSRNAAELRNVPRAHLATRQAQKVPIYRPGTRNTQ